ncbi:MAG: Gfo/Idh/MocA family oxidoreductase [Thermodesulfobacteriota bacterium]
MDKIRVGVVGVGYFGQFHAEKYSKMEGVDLVGVVDINPIRSREVAKRYQTQSFENYTQLLGKVQAVSIVSPTTSHYSIAKDFFLHDIDVLLEKPMVESLEEAKELVQLAEERKLIFQVGHLERFNGALLAAQDLIEKPSFIEFQRFTPFSGRGMEVDVVLDLMIHDIDILLSWIPSPVKSLLATGLPILTYASDVAQARIEFENGCVASLLASRISKEKIRKARVFQTQGMILIDFLTQRASYIHKEEPLGMRTRKIPVKKVDSLELEIQEFINCVRERREPKVSGREGKRVLEVALQIIRQLNLSDKNSG